MYKSARILGSEHGMNSQEMNCYLKSKGFLEGTFNDYSLTEKGREFAKYNDRGYRVWDDSIDNHLDYLEEDKIKATKEVIEHRYEQRLKSGTYKKEQQLSPEKTYTIESNESCSNSSDVLVRVAIVGGVILLCKTIPKIIRWFKNKKTQMQTNQ